jgi:YegS/Rv2252/BmrU family lipid kinase
MYKNYLIFNSRSGRARKRNMKASDLIKMLHWHGLANVELVEEGMSSIVPHIDPDSMLIIAGGDGTLLEAMQVPGILEMPIAIIPLGTLNNLAWSAHIPFNLDDACEVAANGRIRRIDLGRAGNMVFTQAAGAGFDARAFHVYGTSREKSLFKAVRAFTAALATWEPQMMRVEIDGEETIHEAVQVTAANTPVYGADLKIAPDAVIDDGELDVGIIIGCKPRAGTIKCLLGFMEGKTLDPSNILRVRARRVGIYPATDAMIPVHADAAPIGYCPVTIEVMPSCLRLMVPS